MPTLKDLRERAMLSQGELAKALHVHRMTVVAWEHGDFKPRPNMQRQLVALLQCIPDELLAAIKETQALRKERDKPPEDEKERAAA